MHLLIFFLVEIFYDAFINILVNKKGSFLPDVDTFEVCWHRDIVGATDVMMKL